MTLVADRNLPGDVSPAGYAQVVLTAAVVTALLMASGCSNNGAEQKVQEFTGLIAQTAAANRAPAAFGKVGVEVSGPLSCSTHALR